MLMKTITYEDYNGEKKTKNFYFNLSRTEITKLQFENGGLNNHLKKMIESDDTRELYKFFEEFVLACYGERSADGELFLKNDAVRERFQCHPAYDIFMTEMIEGGDKAMANFINSVMPKDVVEAISKMDKKQELKNMVGFDVVPDAES